MNYIEHNTADTKIVELISDGIIINTEQDALDLMANIDYKFKSRKIIIDKEYINEDFFDLKSKLAGNILQKFANYKVQLAILGDFSQYESKSLQDFIFETNKGGLIMFLPDLETALAELVK